MPPPHGNKPTVASGSASIACCSAIRMSHASAHSSPPPIANPLIAAIVTPRKFASRSNAPPNATDIVAATPLSPSANSFRSAPGREELLAAAGDDDRVDRFVGRARIDERLESLQALFVPRIGRRIVDRHERRVAAHFDAEFRGLTCDHRITSVAPSISTRRAMMTRMISFVPSRIWWTRLSLT